MQEKTITLAYDTRHTTHDTRHTTHAPVVDSHNDAGREALTSPAQAQNSDEVIHVVLLLYDPSGSYSQHAGVVMTSIFENTKSKIIVHIVHDETLTDDNRQRFIRTAEKYSQTLDFIDVAEHKKHFTDTAADLARKKCTIGSLYRLFVPELLYVHKVIYLDCDIVVNLDVQEMWNIDVEDYCLAGVHSAGFESLSEALRDRLNGSRAKTFINAGVMLMNLDKIRERGNLFQNAMKWIERRVHLMNFSDQDVINNLFYGSIKLIDGKFNNCNPQTWEQIKDSIIHTPTPVFAEKSWGLLGLPVQHLYWQYYAHTAWGENKSKQELIEVLLITLEKSQASKPYPLRTKQYAAEIFRRIIRKVFCGHDTVNIIRYLAKEAYYRVTHIFSRS